MPPQRAPRTHVVLLDGTMSSLTPGYETNIGLTYKLLAELRADARTNIYYEQGIQFRGIGHAHEVLAGIGINHQIQRSYLFLARNYRPGDQIFMFGYSRGAYAVRSLAGLIDRMGLVRGREATATILAQIYDHYRRNPEGHAAQEMRDRLAHPAATITFIGVYDTVRALGIRWPVLWRFLGEVHPYHSHALGASTQIGRHALALNETRDAYRPVIWNVPESRACRSDDHAACDIVQMWFRGTHGDVGGQLNGRHASRPLANIPLLWMLAEAERAGLGLPDGWRGRYLADAQAPSIGPFAGWAKFFFDRSLREIGRDPSEALHPSAEAAAAAAGVTLPLIPIASP
ncbi:MAG: DUF2235 domain-containing protein [Pseudomonadota bacterium]